MIVPLTLEFFPNVPELKRMLLDLKSPPHPFQKNRGASLRTQSIKYATLQKLIIARPKSVKDFEL